MQRKTPTPILFGAIIFGATGVLIFWLALTDIIGTWKFLDAANKAEGTVEHITTKYTEVGTRPDRSRSITNLALIRYSLADGTTIEFEHTYGLLEGILEPGEQVNVAYSPDEPKNARVVLFSALWPGNIAMIIMSGIFIGASVLLIRVFGK